MARARAFASARAAQHADVAADVAVIVQSAASSKDLALPKLTEFSPGDKVRVTFGERTRWHQQIRRPASVVGVVLRIADGGLDLVQEGHEDTRYGFSGFTWGRVFSAGYRGLVMSVQGAPTYQATVVKIEKSE